jgi:hypothetical protein
MPIPSSTTLVEIAWVQSFLSGKRRGTSRKTQEDVDFSGPIGEPISDGCDSINSSETESRTDSTSEETVQ